VQKEGPAKGKRNGVIPCTGEEGRVLSTKLNVAPLLRRHQYRCCLSWGS